MNQLGRPDQQLGASGEVGGREQRVCRATTLGPSTDGTTLFACVPTGREFIICRGR